MSANTSARFTNLEGERAMIAGVHALMDTKSDEEIAAATGYTLDFVKTNTAAFRSASGVWVRDNRTGKTLSARTYRGAYRIVCMRGLTDWDFGAA